MKSVLILCTGNSCRSQMAEALWQDLGGGEWQAASAGSNPSGYVHPLAITAMSELGTDLSSHRSKSVDEFADSSFDLVVTVCDNARDSCPTFSNATDVLHWPFEDPADATGSEAERLEVFRQIREQIRSRIQTYLEDGS